MHGRAKGAMAALAVALTLALCPAANAEFSEGWAAMKTGSAVQADLTVQFSSLDSFSEEALTALNGWLSRVSFRASVEQSEESFLTNGAVLLDGGEAFSAAVRQEPQRTLTVFSSGGAYVTSPNQPDALSLLAGAGDGIPAWTKLPESYSRIAPALYAALEQTKPPKHSDENTSIKNASASDASDTYTLTEEEMNAVWPQLLEILRPEIETIFKDAPSVRQTILNILGDLKFSGQCRFKRFLDQTGGDMGLQFTGNADCAGDTRKVTLYGGFTPGRGGYISLSLPAVKGKNNWKAVLTGKLSDQETKKTLTLSGSFSRSAAGQTDSASLEATLTNNVKDNVEAWSGKVELDVRLNGEKANWLFKPDMILDEQGLHGTVSFQKKSGSKTLAKGGLTLTLAPIPAVPIPDAAAAADLRELQDAEARAAVQSELALLSGGLLRLLGEMPDETRALLTHYLRNDDWMNAPTVQTLDGQTNPDVTEENMWIVSEEVDEP